MLKKSPRFTRIVRTEDLRTATRLNALFSSADPKLFAGQTFLQTSAAALTALKSSGETPFVFGLNESDGDARRPGLDARQRSQARRRRHRGDSHSISPACSPRSPRRATITAARSSASSPAA